MLWRLQRVLSALRNKQGVLQTVLSHIKCLREGLKKTANYPHFVGNRGVL